MEKIITVVLISALIAMALFEHEAEKAFKPYTRVVYNVTLHCVPNDIAGKGECDWDRFSADVTKCKEASLNRRTTYDVNNNRVVFPAVKNECGM